MDTSLEPLVPDELWRRSGRPMRGQLLRFYIGAAIMAAAYFVPLNSPGFWALICGGIVFMVLFPTVIERFVLAPLSNKVGGAKKSDAQSMLSDLREKQLVQLFAPNAWLPLQEARLHWRRRDGRAAAKCFGEALRHTKVDPPHALWSAQGQAHLIAGDRKEAKMAIERVPESSMGGRDRLALGILLLSESGKNPDAVGELEAAHEDLGDHVRVLAALALGLQRVNREAEAADLLRQAEALLETDARLGKAGAEGLLDPLAPDLAKRARKGLRRYLKTREESGAPKGKKEGKKPTQPANPDQEARGGQSTQAPSPAEQGSETRKKPKKASKKARKQARREARKQAKAEERARKQAEREAAERQAEQSRRAEVEAAIAGKPAAVSSRPATAVPAPKPAPNAAPKPAPAVQKPVPRRDIPKPAPAAVVAPKLAPPKLAPSKLAAPPKLGSPVIAPPKLATPSRPPSGPGTGKGLFDPPSFAPPKARIAPPAKPAPPFAAAPQPAPSADSDADDGWGDALAGIDLPPPPVIAPPVPPKPKPEPDS